jgi:hypothetical protein
MGPALRQVLLGRPGWVPRGASLALDFANARYWSGTQVRGALEALPGWSYSRSGQELAADAAGVYAAYAANVPAINSAGLAIWEARTNKNTNFNAAPTDTSGLVVASGSASLSIVDDVAALAAAGLSVGNGKVVRIDNSANGTASIVNFPGAVGNTNPHVATAFVRGGTGTFGINATGGRDAFTASAAYVRRTALKTPTTGLQLLSIQADAGQVLSVTLNGLSEGAAVTPPIIVAGASATRGAPVANVSLAGLSGTSITVDYGTASSVTFARNTLADPDILPLGAASAGAWVNNVIRRVVLR